MDQDRLQNTQQDKGKEIVVVDAECAPIDYDFDWDAENFDLDTDDEFELEYLNATVGQQDPLPYLRDAASSSTSSSSVSRTVAHFISMGFPEKLVIQAVKENGVENSERILNSLLTYSALENPGKDLCSSPPPSSEDSDYFSDSDSTSGDARINCDVALPGNISTSTDKYQTVAVLLDMGYDLDVVLTAMERCGSSTPIDELADFICAAEVARREDLTREQHACSQSRKRNFIGTPNGNVKKKIIGVSHGNGKKTMKPLNWVNDCGSLCLPNPMIGFGAPGFPPQTFSRLVPSEAAAPPYFYYENVALTPKGVWQQISDSLYGIKPEFVDAIHFSVAARKRGYIHNLPIENRRPLLPIPPMTIHEALPDTMKWWPSWDERKKLNCLLTCIGSARLTERIRKRVESGNPSQLDKKFVIQQCKKWNLVWIGRNKVAVLEPEEMEVMLGFPRNHTRGGGISRVDRYKALGNSFQIDTVAYHLSVLKPLYPNGMNVLSLFSGIGGAEVALHRLGIPLNNVVSVEISSVNRQILQDWWEETEQRGRLIHMEDVRDIDTATIERWIAELDGFDLVIGGSPCNNLAGGNRRTRDGLEGEQSSLFFEYQRILKCVMSFMRRHRQNF